jgi:hypothetical protein
VSRSLLDRCCGAERLRDGESSSLHAPSLGRRLGRTAWTIYKVSGRVAGAGSLAYVVARKCRRRPEPRPRRPPSRADCQPVSRNLYRRPDPLIYSQAFLLANGLGVTWDNPDITIEQDGSQVDSHALEAGTEYEIVARVWNGSPNAPAPALPVRFSFLTFGIGQASTPIGVTHVDLGVKGSAQSPAIARHAWVTPSTPGHYCVQVELEWADDANPGNNLGQENVDVAPLNSPRAAFRFPVRNATRRETTLRLEADGYRLVPPSPCDESPAKTADISEHERQRRIRAAVAAHRRRPPPDDWTLEIEPAELLLAPGQEDDVQVNVFAPEGFEGRAAINVNAFAGQLPVGGVTLYVEGRA